MRLVDSFVFIAMVVLVGLLVSLGSLVIFSLWRSLRFSRSSKIVYGYSLLLVIGRSGGSGGARTDGR